MVVCGHYGCGGVHALDEGVDDPAIADWLLIAAPAKAAVDALAPTDAQRRHRLLVEENVRLQVAHVQSLGVVRRVRAESGGPRVHGWVYDLESGELDVVVDGAQPVELEER